MFVFGFKESEWFCLNLFIFVTNRVKNDANVFCVNLCTRQVVCEAFHQFFCENLHTYTHNAHIGDLSLKK